MQTSLRRMWIQLTADRKRFGVLCATLGMGLLLWARLIIVSNVPRTAVADPGKAASVEPHETAKGAKSATGAADKPAARDGAKAPAKAAQPIAVQLWKGCERDPFVISPVYFPKAFVIPEVKQEAGKLPTEPAEDPSQIEARLVARLRELLGSVKLEAAIGNSRAVIGGKPYRVGDLLPGLGKELVVFTVAEVRQRSVVLDFQGRRFEVEMSLPGEAGN